MCRQRFQQLPTIAPMMPVQWHVYRFIGQKLNQRATGQLLSRLLLGNQSPTQPGLSQTQKPF